MLHRKGSARTALALSLFLALAVASSASAAPVEGPAGEAFYTPPATLPEGGPGTLVWYRPTNVNLNVEIPAVNGWDVLYKSTNQLGEEDVVTGTVIVPKAAWTGSGKRPVITYAEGTQGLGHQCAPSIQIANGTEYDGGAMIAALKKGYAVAVTDYEGYTNGSIPSYIAGRDEGHAVLDAVRAAQQVPGSGVSAEAPVVIWGYSQGGQAAAWAGQILNTYAPEMHVVGDAVGGVPGNLQAVAEFGEGTPGSALGLDSAIGLAYAYKSVANPEMQLHELLNEHGLEVVSKLEHVCAIKSIEEFHDVRYTELTKKGEDFTEVEKNNPLLEAIIKEQQLGKVAIPVPVYHYHGLEDEFVPIKQDAELHEAWCGLGVKDDFQLYPGEHLLTDPTAVLRVMSWVEERIAGKAAPSTCGQHSSVSELPASARLTPEVGDLIIPLPNWQITGSVTAAKLGTSLAIPAGATLNAEGDVTTGKLTATLHVPPIKETMKLFGLIPVTISASLEQAGPIEGKIGLANNGELSLSATGGSILTAKSIGILFLTIPIGCHTASPIQMPLNVTQSANALYTGSVSFTDTVTIPPFTGCSIVNELLTTSLLSGEGNKISITSSPPPPVAF